MAKKNSTKETLTSGQGAANLEREIARLRRQLEESGDPTKDAAFIRMQNELAKMRGKLKAAHVELESAKKRNELLIATEETPDVEKWRQKKGSGGRATAIIVLSDWHVEEIVEADKVNGLNEFNLDIAEKRIERTFQKALYLLEFSRKIANVDEIVVALLGDFITGYIHEELEESNELSPLEASRWVQGRIVSGLEFLKKSAKASIVVPTCFGNHGRTTKKKRVSTGAENSYEYNLYKQIEGYFQNEPSVLFKVERGYHNYLRVQRTTVRFHHGDNIKYGGGVGGITIPVNKAIAQWNKSIPAGLDVFGHFHQYVSGGLNWHCNGSLIGYGPYAVAIKGGYERPMQSFILVDRDYGPCVMAPIFCDEAGENDESEN